MIFAETNVDQTTNQSIDTTAPAQRVNNGTTCLTKVPLQHESLRNDSSTNSGTPSRTIEDHVVVREETDRKFPAIQQKICAHYRNLAKIDCMLYEETADRLAMFRVFQSQMLEYGLLVAADDSSGIYNTTTSTTSAVSDNDILRMLDTLQRIYIRLESILNHLLFIGKFELHRQIVTLIT